MKLLKYITIAGLIMSTILLLIPVSAYAQSEVINAIIASEVPLWEKIVLGIFGMLFLAFGVFLAKGLPRIIDRRQKLRDQDLDKKIDAANEKATHAEEIEIEVRQILKENSNKMEKIFEELIGMNKKINNVETKQEQIFEALTEQDEVINKASQGTLEVMLFSDSYTNTLNRLKAFYRLICMGINGNVLDRGTNLIMECKENKQLWLNVLSLRMEDKIVNETYYKHAMEHISRLAFNNLMGNYFVKEGA